MKEQQQEIILLYVVQPHDDSMKSYLSRKIQSSKTGDTITLEQYLKDSAMETKNDAKNTLEDKIKTVEPNGFTLQSRVLHVNPAEEILKFSQLEKIDLIVIGNVGQKDFKNKNIRKRIDRGIRKFEMSCFNGI